MGGKQYKDWAEVKKDMIKWNNINLGCLVIALLFIIAGAAAGTLSEPLDIDFNMAPTSFFLLVIFFAVVSIAPHIQLVALKTWYPVESERKNM